MVKQFTKEYKQKNLFFNTAPLFRTINVNRDSSKKNNQKI